MNGQPQRIWRRTTVRVSEPYFPREGAESEPDSPAPPMASSLYLWDLKAVVLIGAELHYFWQGDLENDDEGRKWPMVIHPKAAVGSAQEVGRRDARARSRAPGVDRGRCAAVRHGGGGGMRTKLLDHGYLELIETWGSDERIIESARMSTDGAFRGWGRDPALVAYQDGDGGGPYYLTEDGTTLSRVEAAKRYSLGRRSEAERDIFLYCERTGARFEDFQVVRDAHVGDEKLLKFLWDNAHATPFEMCGLTIEVKAPIMVFREWHRHRIPFGYNELSARYTPLPNENYVPSVERLMINSTKNKQAGVAKGADELTDEAAIQWLDALEEVYAHAERVYQMGLAMGVPKELARLPVPVGRYSRMRATGNLRGWLAFLKLRAAPQAQWEIRQFAHGIAEIIKHEFPRTYMVSAESLGL